jgi:hypothetical protein
VPHETGRNTGTERWSVQLELADDEVAKLYGQGALRGAVVWRKGMVEWRPLLSTPELSGLLRRTGVTPHPVRATYDVVIPAELAARAVTPTTVAPTAMDVQPPPSKPRRSVELAAVAVAAFALAWIGHGKLTPRTGSTASSSPATLAELVAPPAPACEPQRATSGSTSLASSNIRTVLLTDLPLLGASTAVTTHAVSSHRNAARKRSTSGGPSRSELVSAMSGLASAASGCGERGGAVHLVMSFTNSGVARGIRVSGEDLPAATRSCIIGAAARARVPAFTGDAVTVGKTL